ncbi:TIGR02391 family protein, partial [Alteromonas ponticola]
LLSTISRRYGSMTQTNPPPNLPARFKKGFANFLKGVFGTFRNTTAHAPRVTWVIEEQDALDILSTVSLIHRRLDGAIEAQKLYRGRP